MEKINLAKKLALFHELWSPKIVAEVNDTHIKLSKLQGEFDWHRHELEDELFLVLHGRLQIQFQDHDVWLEEGEMLVVPRGVAHRPVAPEEVHVLLVEPRGTVSTGNLTGDDRSTAGEWI